MNQNITIFENPQFGKIRTIEQSGEPWFVAQDVCAALELSNVSVSVSRLDHDEVAKFNLGGRSGETNIVSESGLYTLVLGSRKPEAREFKRWITHEVIPSIRKHGAYMTPDALEQAVTDPDFIIGLLQGLKEEQAKRIAAEQYIKSAQPAVLFAKSVQAAHTSILIGELAKILKQNGIEVGQNRLFEQLRKDGYLISRQGFDYNMPTQRSMELGLFDIKETAITHSDGHVTISKTVKVTGKGQVYFVNRYLKEDSK